MITRKVIIKGKVQGVFFRDYTRRQASGLGLTGWVRNLPDGSVEALLSGEDNLVRSMLAWFHEGSPHSKVDEVLVYETESDKSYSSFDIRY